MRFHQVILPITAGLFFRVFAQTPPEPARGAIDPGVITTRQAITPAGAQFIFSGRIQGIAFGASSSEILVSGASLDGGLLYHLDWKKNHVFEKRLLTEHPGMQGLAWDAVGRRALLTATQPETVNGKPVDDAGLFAVRDGTPELLGAPLGTNSVAGVSLAEFPERSGQRLATVALTFDNEVAVVNAADGHLVGRIKTGIAPFGTVVGRDGRTAYVSNWGGRFPRPGEATAPTGTQPGADRVLIDSRGIASSGTVSRVDLTTLKVTHTIPVGLHPTALAWDQAHHIIYVTNGNDDSVSVISDESHAVVSTFHLRPFNRPVAGIAPTSIAVDAAGKRLYVSCGGINAVAVLHLPDGEVEGMIPTGWYPVQVSLSGDGKYLAVATLLGIGSGWNSVGNLYKDLKREFKVNWMAAPTRRYAWAYRGTVQVLAVPDAAQLVNYSTAVAENNHMLQAGQKLAEAPSRSGTKPLPVPLASGDPSLIEHVVYIVKENRSYDQVFGDIQKGNGDPSLEFYPMDVTPNHHRLAEQFVLLDNFYASGGRSADGHQWVTQANETDYCYWPGYAGRSYPFDGTDPIAYSKGGFIWDAALKKNKSVRIFGEYLGVENLGMDTVEGAKVRAKSLHEWEEGASFVGRFHTRAPIGAMQPIVAAEYPAYGGATPDVVRARIFNRAVDEWDATGKMPNLVIAQLPADHTAGISPGYSSPKAAVADNDYALGQIVERLSRSRFWSKMAIFVVEDDARDGLDHVDGHRTVALAISPYIRRGAVDSTFYSHPSLLKTIELMLGLPTLSLFDLIANDMRNSFQLTPDLTPYSGVAPKQSLFEVNPPALALRGAHRKAALASLKMNFREPDAAPAERLAEILWHDVKGWDKPYRKRWDSVFLPYAARRDGEER